jgi:hypothetical protein
LVVVPIPVGVIIGDCGTTSFGAAIPVPMLDQPPPLVEVVLAPFSGARPVFVLEVEGHGDAAPPFE